MSTLSIKHSRTQPVIPHTKFTLGKKSLLPSQNHEKKPTFFEGEETNYYQQCLFGFRLRGVVFVVGGFFGKNCMRLLG